MELRVLHYFLAVAREQSISAAAKSLHLSQPTLSTQLRALEQELGKPLLVRGSKGSRKITLTEEGMLLRKRAEEILELVRKTENEITLSDDTIAGDVYIGAGETRIMRLIARAACDLQKECPDIHCHISSGNARYVMEQLDKGLIDFGLLYAAVDPLRYNSIPIPLQDEWGVLMRRDAPLADHPFITPGRPDWTAAHPLTAGRDQPHHQPLDELRSCQAERRRHIQPDLQRFAAGRGRAGIHAVF